MAQLSARHQSRVVAYSGKLASHRLNPEQAVRYWFHPPIKSAIMLAALVALPAKHISGRSAAW